MSFWVSWVILGVLFIIIEMFVLTLDFLAIGIAALITGWFVYFNNYTGANLLFVGTIFLVLSVIMVFISRMFFFPIINKTHKEKTALSVDNIVGQHLIVQDKDGQKMVYYEGNFWIINTDDQVYDGDSVEVLEVHGSKLKVKKIF